MRDGFRDFGVGMMGQDGWEDGRMGGGECFE